MYIWRLNIWWQDPAIAANETEPYPAYESAIEADVFIKYPKEISDEIVWGKVRGKPRAYNRHIMTWFDMLWITFQVWPDLPNVIVNESLDWELQVKVLCRTWSLYLLHT